MVPCVGGLLRRIAFAPVVFLAVAASLYLILRVLRPDLYPDEAVLPGVAGDVGDVVLHFDLGCASSLPGCPDLAVLWRRGAPADLWLLAGALASGTGLGVLGGLWCAGHPRAFGAKVLHVLASLAYCAPVYVVGLGLLYLFNPVFGRLHVPWFFDADARWVAPWTNPWLFLRVYLVPWLVLGAPIAGMCLRMTTVTAREVRREDYVRTAVAKGIEPRQVLRRHVGPVSYASTISFVGVSIPLIVLNVVLVERVLGVPGFFHYLWKAVGHNSESALDLATLSAIALWATVLVIVLELVADAALGRLDPRIRDAAF
jgi:peptide/nickel transport system permease protein